MEGPNLELLNDQLLAADEPAVDAGPRRNTKDDLIEKLERLANEANLDLEAKSKLRRMTKSQLKSLLAKKMEEAVRDQMAEQVGARRGANDTVIALGALRMVHNLAAGVAERGINTVAGSRGFSVEGFAQRLSEPPTKEAVDACLQEIAETTDVLGYIESPYARLAIAWGGALVASIKRVPIVKNGRHAARMGPEQARAKDPLQRGPGGGAPAGQEHRRVRFAATHAK